jgi:glycosyltransferase involved in cell wall biosynthesis
VSRYDQADSRFVILSLDAAVSRQPGVITYVGAMAEGKCVVTNDPSGSSSYLKDGETGFIVPAADVNALRTRILALLDNPDLVRAIGREAQLTAREKFSPACYYAEVERVARELAASARRRS